MSKESVSQVRPWVRYFARMFDYYLFVIIFGFFLGLINADIGTGNEFIIFSVIPIFIWTFIEGFLLCTWGTTLGKFLFGIKVRDKNGKKLTLDSALTRSFRVWFFGMGMGIPIVSLFTLIISYSRLKEDKITRWDKEGEIRLIHQKIGIIKIMIIAVFILFFIFIIAYSEYRDINNISYSANNITLMSVTKTSNTQTLEAGYVQYNEFTNQNLVIPLYYKFSSDLPISVYAVPSKEDYDNFRLEQKYNIYDNCFFESRAEGEINCSVSSGGLVIYNPNTQNVTFTIST